jgi:hypothetical protein
MIQALTLWLSCGFAPYQTKLSFSGDADHDVQILSGCPYQESSIAQLSNAMFANHKPHESIVLALWLATETALMSTLTCCLETIE